MTDLELLFMILLIPVAYVLVYMAGKYDLISLIAEQIGSLAVETKEDYYTMTCPKCGGKLRTTDITHDTFMNYDHRKKKCVDCGSLVCTTEVVVENNAEFKKKWAMYNRAWGTNRKKEN